MKENGSVLWSVIFAGLGILGIYLASLFWKYLKLRSFFERNNVPHKKPLPIFGNSLSTVMKQKSKGDFILDLYAEFPDAKYSGVFEFMNPVYVVRDAELIKSIGVKYFDHFTDHTIFANDDADSQSGGNLIMMKGERWKEMRAMITPVFSSSKMRTMFELISKCADDFVDYLNKQPSPVTLDMKDTFTRYTNDVIATSAFGVSVNSLANKDNEFYLMGKDATTFDGVRMMKMFLLTLSPSLANLLKVEVIPSRITNFFYGLISETITVREQQGILRPDLIHQLMQARHKKNNEKLTTAEITAQSFVFFFAGFETVSTLMCFASHQLAVHPDIQDKLIAEIDAAYKEEGDKLSYEKVNSLGYLEMFLMETLRYYPPIVVTDRMSTREFELPPATETGKPILLKPGSRVWFPTIALHRDPKYFPNPDKFDPERFSPDNKNSINNFAFLPFGVGPRSCPGNRLALLETKLVLCKILQKFRFRVGAKTHVPLVLSRKLRSMTAEHGFWLDLEPRNTAN